VGFGQRRVSIKKKSFAWLIVKTYADSDQKKILDAAQKPRIICDIIDKCNLPQTSTYRKMNLLIQNGLLVPYGSMVMKHGKVVTRYVSLFENLEINIEKNNILITAKISERARQALLRIMREKIIGLSKNLRSGPTRIFTEAVYEKMQKEGSGSIIPYLMKDLIRV